MSRPRAASGVGKTKLKDEIDRVAHGRWVGGGPWLDFELVFFGWSIGRLQALPAVMTLRSP